MMRAIDNVVKEMRCANRTITASMIAAWKSGLSFISILIVAFLYRSDPSLVVSSAKYLVALVALLTWFADSYFIRKHWALKK